MLTKPIGDSYSKRNKDKSPDAGEVNETLFNELIQNMPGNSYPL